MRQGRAAMANPRRTSRAMEGHHADLASWPRTLEPRGSDAPERNSLALRQSPPANTGGAAGATPAPQGAHPSLKTRSRDVQGESAVGSGARFREEARSDSDAGRLTAYRVSRPAGRPAVPLEGDHGTAPVRW
jgi:hypothetical protein